VPAVAQKEKGMGTPTERGLRGRPRVRLGIRTGPATRLTLRVRVLRSARGARVYVMGARCEPRAGLATVVIATAS
jgi:hypothetical protein